jgi:hypothetical protein
MSENNDVGRIGQHRRQRRARALETAHVVTTAGQRASEPLAHQVIVLDEHDPNQSVPPIPRFSKALG